MARLPSADDTRFWGFATWSLAGFFGLQLVFMTIAARIANSDSDAMYIGAFVAASVAGIVLTLLLRWRARGAVRGVTLAAATATGIWIVSSAVIAGLYLASG